MPNAVWGARRVECCEIPPRLALLSKSRERPQQPSELLDGIEVEIGRLLLRIPGVLPAEAECGGRLPPEPLEVLLLGPQDLRVVPVVAEDDDAGFEILQLGDRRFSQRGDPVLDPAEAFEQALVDAVGLSPANGDEEDQRLRPEQLAADLVELVVLVVDGGPASVLARRVLATIGQLRLEHAAVVAALAADVALADMNLELGDIDQRHLLSSSSQVISDSKRQLCGLRDIPRVLFVPVARGQQQDVIPRLEMADEPRAWVSQTGLRGDCSFSTSGPLLSMIASRHGVTLSDIISGSN